MIESNLVATGFEITADELYSDLHSNKPLLVFDLRLKEHFVQGHIDGSVHAVCDTHAKKTIMPRIPRDVKVVLIDEDGKVSGETAMMMKSMGFDAYFLKDGIRGWNKDLIKKDLHTIILAEDVWKKLQRDDVFLIDVRQADEFADFKIPGSVNIPLSDLFKPEIINKIPKDKQIVTICPHGNRAMIASFALARNGIDASVLAGGLATWGQILSPHIITREPFTIIQVEKIGKGCLSYIVGSEGKALVIDPVQPFEKYKEYADAEGFIITKIIDTHLHADHVSAARDLAKITNSKIYLSKHEGYSYEGTFVDDGFTIMIGKSKLHVMHTPGHTPGSLCFVLDEKYVFTGDTLFVESIGRPDLHDKAPQFAGDLYETLHHKLLNMPENRIILPCHRGEGVKSKNDGYYSTISDAKKLALLDLKKNEFVQRVVKVVLPRPMNYSKIIQINKGIIQVTPNEIPDLEIGPNRCAIST